MWYYIVTDEGWTVKKDINMNFEKEVNKLAEKYGKGYVEVRKMTMEYLIAKTIVPGVKSGYTEEEQQWRLDSVESDLKESANSDS